MNSLTLGKDYLQKAKVRREALEVFVRRKAYADVVREAQEIVELALKASLRVLVVEPPKVHDVAPYFKEVRRLLPLRWQRNLAALARISRKLAEDRSPAFYGDEESLTPASELFGIRDAKRAMAGGGKLSVSISKQDRQLTITIQDTGKGIAKEHLNRIFDPFFTTKHHGTGLGLSIVHSIIKEHRGTITIDSQPGQGTRCTLTFPLKDG